MARKSTTKADALVIVESPAKAQTINKYLGDRYLVKASMGHVRDLPRREFGIDIAAGFEPTYRVLPGREKVVNELAKLAKRVREVYLATDLDREGEAIAWHLVHALAVPPERVRRVIFNEITESAIKHAFEHPHELDLDKVYAQQARRVLDRIVGYELSPLLWRKIAKGLSAGRVQSVAVRLIVEREREIRAFVPEEFWEVTAALCGTEADTARMREEWDKFLACVAGGRSERTAKEQDAWLGKRGGFRASLVEWAGKPFKPTNADQARAVVEALGYVVERVHEAPWKEYEARGLKLVELRGRLDPARAPVFRVQRVETKRTRSRPAPPFTTSSLQQAASTQLRFSASRTMRVAQQLYEGIDLGGAEGPVGLITYMRTDSVSLSKESVVAARRFIEAEFGAKYLPAKPNKYSAGKRAQEAHEAIRPTMPDHTPERVKPMLTRDQYKLYDLVWRRFTACQMVPAEWDSTTALISARAAAGEALLKATGRTLVFDGHLRVTGVPAGDEQTLPKLAAKQQVAVVDLRPNQGFTSPPPRYNQASLVKKLESEGIGRPSTYAAILQTIEDRGYVEQRDRRYFATPLGEVVTDKLVEHFPRILDVKFTAFMEDELDKIEEAHKDWVGVLHEFYDPFHTALEAAKKNMDTARAEASDVACGKCGKPMVYRWSKTGRFLACTGYPECKTSHNVDGEGRPIYAKESQYVCEACGRPTTLRQSRTGYFLGCTGYPECRATIPCDAEGNPYKLVKDEEVEATCEQCGGPMRVRRKGARAFLGCTNYPTCRHTTSLPEGIRLEKKPVAPPEQAGVACEKCGRPMVIRSGSRGRFIACTGYPRCRSTHPIEQLDALRASRPLGADDGDGAEKPAARPKTAKKAAKPASKSAKTSASATGDGDPPPGFAFTRGGRLVVEDWPAGPLLCPQCGGEMALKPGRWGPFYSCSSFPKCKVSANLRGEAKKRAATEGPTRPERPKPIATEIECEQCGSKMLIRAGRNGQFLGCGNYPKCKNTRPIPAELIGSTANGKPA